MGLRWSGKYVCGAMLALPFCAQNNLAAGQAVASLAQPGISTLHIEILEGEGALNNIRQRDAREPVVQITDENHKPVSSVAVLFLIHTGNGGAGATFGGQSLSFTATTGPDGIAHASALQLSHAPGSFTISVSATLGSIVAQTVIHQSNTITALSSTSASTSASGTATGSTATSTVATHTILGVSKLVAITIGSAAVAGVVVVVVQATKSSGTSLTLGQGTITASAPARGARK